MMMQQLLCLLTLLLVCSTAGATGFERIAVPDGNAAPLEVGIWYPTDTPAKLTKLGPFEMQLALGAPIAPRADHTPYPLVMISHGSGGTYLGHFDTAIALTNAGYIVAAVMHRGDNYADDSRVTHIMDRPAHIRHVLDHLLESWQGREHIDPARIGMFGFSAGGFTTLVLIGGEPDFTTIEPYCRDHAQEFTCQLVSGQASDKVTTSSASLNEPRIRAAVVAAPALGFTFAPHGLERVSVPVELWRAEADTILPFPNYAEAVRASLPVPPSINVEPNAGHFDFLTPCSEALRAIAEAICTSAEGFDRQAFHDRFNASLIRFFDTQLTP